MFIKTILLFLFLILTSVNSISKDTGKFKTIKISKTFTVLISKTFNPQINLMPSFNGFWIESIKNNKKISIWISRKIPETLATIPTVNRFWKENLNTALAIGEKSEDKGCGEVKQHLFICERSLKSKSKNFVSEKTFWNANKDIVLIRVMTKSSKKEADEILNEIKFNFVEETI